MPLRNIACFSCRWLTFWTALSILEGQHSSLFHGEENRPVSLVLTKADEEPTGVAEFPVGCSPRRLTKRSRSFDVPWYRSLDSQETNCQIFPVTTVSVLVTKTQSTTKDPRKATHSTESASPEHRPQILYFLPYYPRQQHTFFHALFPVNRGVNKYNTIWYNKFSRDDSSEEKRRRRDTLTIGLEE